MESWRIKLYLEPDCLNISKVLLGVGTDSFGNASYLKISKVIIWNYLYLPIKLS